MQHSFDIDIAKEYGILEAILLNNMQFWIEKNKANGINYYDGNYFIIRRACYTVIPLLVLSVFSVIIIIKRWLSVLRNYQIIK